MRLILAFMMSVMLLTACGGKEIPPADISSAVTGTTTEATSESTAVTLPSSTALIQAVTIPAERKYAYNHLSETEQKYYDAILSAAEQFEPTVILEGCDRATYDKVFTCVVYQETQLFYLKKKPEFIDDICYLTYVYSEEEAAEMQSLIDEQVAEILSLCEGGSDYDKLLTFHDWLVLHNHFELAGAETATIYAAFVAGTAQCNGYAAAMQYLCNAVGIPCMVVCGGTPNGVSHAWNKVQVDGQWYNLDVTWDDPYDSQNPKPADHITHRYFLVTDAEINELTHLNVNCDIRDGTTLLFEPPAATANAYNYSIMEGKYADSAAKAKELFLSQLYAGDKYLEVKCSDKAVYDEVVNQIRSEGLSYLGGGLVFSLSREDRNNTYHIQLNITE